MTILLAVIVLVVIIGVTFWALRALSGTFGIPPQIVVVIQIVVVVLSLLWFLTAVGVYMPLRIR